MRGKIRLDGRKHVETINGFPVVFYVTKDKKEKLILTGYHSKKEHWDKSNSLPLSKHPDYVNLLNYLESKKIKLKKLLDKSKHENIPLAYAEKYLKNTSGDIFYDDAIELAKTLVRPYTTVLNSFNSYYPNYPYTFITKETAKEYMNTLLKTPVNGKQRSPNGVISYMGKLTAIWNKLDKPNNPFRGVLPKKVPTKSKALTTEDLIKLKSNPYLNNGNSKAGGVYNYINYLLLCFYLGGIDMVDLKNMRYDKNVIGGRIEFIRSKGGTNVFVSNKIFPQAQEILNQYDCKPYLVPLYKLKTYDEFIPNISRRLPQIMERLNLSRLPYSKSARYTFINRGQNLLIDERCVMALVGHSQNTTHSIYKDAFPHDVIDKAHEKIISF